MGFAKENILQTFMILIESDFHIDIFSIYEGLVFLELSAWIYFGLGVCAGFLCISRCFSLSCVIF